ncbi:IDEAL domain-containing protein [Brevibacillus fluminis]|uniref:IDEAL domain-containing protein n=1 Tax=Brevibacillus fluminis TaxID=511487 RepID=A0A3M8D253_9BACL|nr:IDEAL domain-containing protein [Brevibacillus fluminis]RNB81651.1 IDEAL domain-containing protein [Brevibacillus fluminis]
MESSHYLRSNLVSGLLSEMIIDEQVRQFRKRSLYDEIDLALEKRNREHFLTLTNELRTILAYEQSVSG